MGLILRQVACLTIAAMALALPSRAATPAARGRVIFVIDSTAYMATLFGGSSKLVAVSNALGSVWPNHAAHLDLGLVIYGHGGSGQSACATTDRRRAVAPIDGTGASNLLSTLKTKGDAGIALALATAASSKDIKDTPASLVLIAGGPDSCQGDPCAEATKLAAGRDLPVHVIAIDAGGEAAQLQALKCVADATKGGYWQVASTMELAAAMDDALAMVSKSAGTPGAVALRPGTETSSANGASGTTGTGSDAPSVPGQENASAVAVPGGGPQGRITLAALLTDAGPALTSGVTWRVYLPNGTGMKKVLSSSDASPSITLPSGDYFVNAAYGRSYATRKIKVVEGAASEQFVLNAGGLKLGARLADGSLAPAQFVSAEIFSDERDQFGNRTKLAEGIKPGVVVRLNSGLYHVSATYGDANATVQSDVAVEAGRITDATVTFTAGRVTFRLVQQSGGEALTGTTWTILGGAGETVKHGVAALPTHVLAPGDYSVSAERAGKQYTQDFTVKAGEAIQVEVVAKE